MGPLLVCHNLTSFY